MSFGLAGSRPKHTRGIPRDLGVNRFAAASSTRLWLALGRGRQDQHLSSWQRNPDTPASPILHSTRSDFHELSRAAGPKLTKREVLLEVDPSGWLLGGNCRVGDHPTRTQRESNKSRRIIKMLATITNPFGPSV